MLFNSFAFLCFLPAVLVVYYLLPHRAQNWFLLFASCFGWLIFRADSFAQLTTMLAALFHPSGFDLPLAWKIYSFALPPIIAQMIQYTTKTLNFVKWSRFTPEVNA